jgi:hypothetical protein
MGMNTGINPGIKSHAFDALFVPICRRNLLKYIDGWAAEAPSRRQQGFKSPCGRHKYIERLGGILLSSSNYATLNPTPILKSQPLPPCH